MAVPANPDDRSDSSTPSLTRWEHTLTNAPFWLLAAVAWSLVLIKGGVNLNRPAVWQLSTFPAPEDRLTGTSYGFRLLGWITRTESEQAYVVMATAAVVFTVALVSWLIHRHLTTVDARFALLLLTSGSLGTVLLGNIGRLDVFVILGAALLGIRGAALHWALIGSIVMALGNPEQAVIALAIYTLSVWASGAKDRVRPGFVALTLVVILTAALTIWARLGGHAGRFGYLWDFLGNSVYHFGRDWPLSLYAAYGSLWIVTGFAIFHRRGRSRALLVFAVVIVPLVATATTLDQTRVFVGVTSAATFFIVLQVTPQLVRTLKSASLPVLTLALFAAVLLPSIEIDFHGSVRVPYQWVFELVPT